MEGGFNEALGVKIGVGANQEGGLAVEELGDAAKIRAQDGSDLRAAQARTLPAQEGCRQDRIIVLTRVTAVTSILFCADLQSRDLRQNPQLAS